MYMPVLLGYTHAPVWLQLAFSNLNLYYTVHFVPHIWCDGLWEVSILGFISLYIYNTMDKHLVPGSGSFVLQSSISQMHLGRFIPILRDHCLTFVQRTFLKGWYIGRQTEHSCFKTDSVKTPAWVVWRTFPPPPFSHH